MIDEMTASSLTAIGTLSSDACSDAALFVARRISGSWMDLQESFALGLAGKGVFRELREVAAYCGMPNWDGYGAIAVSHECVRVAQRFLRALPFGTPAPTVGAEPDGQITLEWHRAVRHTLSVSVSMDGELHYAALFGQNKAYGTEQFLGEAPGPIRDLINRVDLFRQRGAA